MAVENTRNMVCLVCFVCFPSLLNSIVKIARLFPKLRVNIRVVSTQVPTDVSRKISIHFKGFLFSLKSGKFLESHET